VAVERDTGRVKRLAEVVTSLGTDRRSGVIYAAAPWTANSDALIHDPWSVVGPPSDMAALVDAELAREYLRAWASWHRVQPDADALVDALLAFVARPLKRSRARVPGLALHRATTQSGRTFDDPSRDQLYKLFLDVEDRKERFVVVERLSDATGSTFVQALRDDDGRYLVEQRGGALETHLGTVKATMPAAHLAVCNWLFHGIDVTTDHTQRVIR
jgi:hypothetical protein